MKDQSRPACVRIGLKILVDPFPANIGIIRQVHSQTGCFKLILPGDFPPGTRRRTSHVGIHQPEPDIEAVALLDLVHVGFHIGRIAFQFA